MHDRCFFSYQAPSIPQGGRKLPPLWGGYEGLSHVFSCVIFFNEQTQEKFTAKHFVSSCDIVYLQNQLVKKPFVKKCLTFLSLCFPLMVSAQAGWSKVSYSQSMFFSAEVLIGKKPAKQGDEVGAFIDGECRMVAPVLVINGKSTISGAIYGDVNEELEEPEEVEFKLWREKNNTILNTKQRVEMKPGTVLHGYTLKFK